MCLNPETCEFHAVRWGIVTKGGELLWARYPTKGDAVAALDYYKSRTTVELEVIDLDR
jgi:hypothetical protein